MHNTGNLTKQNTINRHDLNVVRRPSPRREHVVRRAFTLIEVLIVLVIVLAIGSIVAVNLMPKKEEAIEKTVQIQLQQIENALDLFNVDIGRYPTQDEGLDVLWDKTKLADESLQSKHAGNYFAKGQKNLKDAWGNPFNYEVLDSSEVDAGGLPYKIWSNGPDGQSGTPDDIYPRKQDNTDQNGMDTSGTSGAMPPPPSGGSGSTGSSGH